MISQEMMVRYAVRGAQAELEDLRAKHSAVLALQPGMANVSPAEKSRMAKALENDIEIVQTDIRELKNLAGM